MKRYGWLAALGVATFLAFVIATLPASLFADRLQKAGLTATALTGSVWNGTATGLAWKGAALGTMEWQLRPLRLLTGRLGAHVSLTRPDGKLESDVDATLSGRVHLSKAEVAMPVEAFASLPLGLPKGWRGRLNAKLDEVVVENRWPTSVRGTIDMDTLTAPPPRNISIGSFHVVLPHPGQAPSAGEITAQVKDKEGPLGVDGRLTLKAADRSFLLDGFVTARPGLPTQLERSMQLLGPTDAAGRRQISIAGTL